MKYSQKIADLICEQLVEGKSLNEIAREQDVHYATIMRWIKTFPEFKTQYIQARKDQAHTLADQILDVARNAANDVISLDGRIVLNPVAVNRARLQIDSMKWLASKMLPKVYSDRYQIVGGDDDDNPVKVEITNRDRLKALTSLIQQQKKDEKDD